jgi:hypothetical protein
LYFGSRIEIQELVLEPGYRPLQKDREEARELRREHIKRSIIERENFSRFVERINREIERERRSIERHQEALKGKAN